MEAITELEALQNAANDLNLTIYERPTQDKRKTVKLYFAAQGQYTVSGNIDYDQMNHFLLGWRKANKFKNKVEKAAPDMLSVLKEAVDHAHVYDTNPNLVELFKAAINKAIN